MVLKNQKGTAMFVAVMMLVLSTGLGLLAFRVSLTELQISSYGKNELAVGYLAESGVEKILSWISSPSRSPSPIFFGSLGSPQQASCTGDRMSPDFQLSSSSLEDPVSGPFSELKEMGKVLDLRLYRGNHPKGICTVEVKAEGGKGATQLIRVDLTRSPIQAMTAAIQGAGNTNVASPIWVHWGKIRYTGNAHLGSRISKIPIRNSATSPDSVPYTEDGLNQDPWLEIQVEKQIESPLSDRMKGNGGTTGEESRPYADRPNVSGNQRTVSLDSVDLNELKDYVKMYGNYYVVSPTGRLEQNGVEMGTFDQVFYSSTSDYQLVWVDRLPGYSSLEPILISQGNYKGYFYFTGNVQIEKNQPGRAAHAQSPPWPSTTPRQIELSHINLDGFFYVLGELNIQAPFSSYGALFAGQGFSGPGAGRSEVWYNHHYHSASYPNVPPVVRLKGTWRSIPVSDQNG